MHWYDIRGRFDARGIRGCRKQASEDLSLIDQLPIAEARKAELRAKIRGASLRKHLAIDYFKHAQGALATLWVVASVAGYGVLIQHGGTVGENGKNPESIDALINVVVIIVCLNMVPAGLRTLFNSKILFRRTLIALGMSIFVIWSIAAIARTIAYREPPKSREELYSLAALASLSLWPIAWLKRRAVSASRAQEMCHAYDTLSLAALKLITTLQKERGRWRRDGTAKRWVTELEKLAEIASYSLACPNRSVAGDRDAEIALRAESRRVAAVFRSHKVDIARAGSISDIDAVIESLTHGLEAILSGNRESLLSRAPDAPPDPYMTISRRIAPGATLIAFGITLPLIPAIAAAPQAESYLRWTLIIAGAVMLTSTNSEVAARVNEALGKSMAMKS
jgi:hypothetical protein